MNNKVIIAIIIIAIVIIVGFVFASDFNPEIQNSFPDLNNENPQPRLITRGLDESVGLGDQ